VRRSEPLFLSSAASAGCIRALNLRASLPQVRCQVRGAHARILAQR